MNRLSGLWCLMLGGGVLVGCKKEEVATPTATQPAGLLGKNATTQVSEMISVGTSVVTSHANEMIQQAKDYLDKNNMLEASAILVKLEAVKEKLPKSVQDQIKSLRGV